MIIFSLILFTLSAMMILSGVLAFLGKYEVIYDYYLCSVNDIKAYSKENGLATMCLALPLIACGVLQLIKPEIPFALIGIGVLVAGIIGFYFWFRHIQKKYNGGMF